MQIILVVLHLFLALGLVGLILIQHGKGADMGAAFGSGASATVFGARGSASFLTRATAGLATIFFITSMVLAYFAAQGRDDRSIMESLQTEEAVEVEQTEVPVAPVIPSAPAESDVPVAPAASQTSVPEAVVTVEQPAATSGTAESVPPVESEPEPTGDPQAKP
jgi:preprotein translocase subunit SecG